MSYPLQQTPFVKYNYLSCNEGGFYFVCMYTRSPMLLDKMGYIGGLFVTDILLSEPTGRPGLPGGPGGPCTPPKRGS